MWPSTSQPPTRNAQGELPLNTWQPLLDALKNDFGTAPVLQDAHVRDQLATLKALEYVKDADPVARYSADIQRLAILGNVGNQELTKLDAFRKGMPAELQRHCLMRPDGSKFETLSQLVTETTALLTAGLKEAAARAPAVRVGSVRAAAPSHAGASTSSGAQARSQWSPEAKRAKPDVGAKSWEVPSDLCTRSWHLATVPGSVPPFSGPSLLSVPCALVVQALAAPPSWQGW